jgi:hypothetical protein
MQIKIHEKLRMKSFSLNTSKLIADDVVWWKIKL